MNIEKAQSQLAAYGYTLTDSLQIKKGDKTFSVVVSAKGPRFYVKQMSGAPLWSGPDLGDFVKSFWHAKKIEQHEANASMLKESDKRVVRAFVNEKPASKVPGVRGRFEMVRTSADPGRAGMHQYGSATVWVSGPVSGTWWATVKFRSQEKDLDAKSYEAVLQEAADWVDAAPELARNGRGIYHGTPAGKHDMVLHQDHRGAWRIDLVTSAGGNHLDVTGPNRGYGSPEEAFQSALDVQRTRGIRGKSHVYIADRDGNLSNYEPMETNGRTRTTFSSRAPEGAIDDDYVVANVDRDANVGLFRVRGNKLSADPIGVSADMDSIVRSMEEDARSRGSFGPAVFQLNDDGGWTHVGNVVNGRYQESGGYQGNGRMHPRTGARVPGPMFRVGDRVERDDGSERGEIAIVGNYDETIGGYRYKVQQDDGARIYWNESSTRPVGHSRNGRATTVDPVAARELDLYIANTYELVGAPNSVGKSIDANLRRKLANGTYDSALSPKAWQHLVDSGAARYEKEFGDESVHIFNAATRRQVAEDFARAWEDENAPSLTANGVPNETNLRQAIVDALHQQRTRKHLEIWRTVSQRYPSTVYADFDALMGKMEMDGTIMLTGSRGPNTYKLA